MSNEVTSEQEIHHNNNTHIDRRRLQADEARSRPSDTQNTCPDPTTDPPLRGRNFLFNAPSSRKRKLRPPAQSSHGADGSSDDDGENKENSRRTTSGKLRWEDNRDTWF